MNSAVSLRRAAVRLLYRLAKSGPLAKLARMILSRRGEQVLNIVSLDQAGVDPVVLAPPSDFVVRSPEFPGDAPNSMTGRFPEIRAYRLRNALISPYSSGWICGDDLVISPHLATHGGRHLPDSDGLFHFGGDAAVSYKRNLSQIEAGIHACGSGAFNWYHFVVEMLPKIFLLSQSEGIPKDLPLILPEEARRIRSFADALAAVAGDRPKIFLKRGEHVLVKDLLVVDEVSYGPFGLPKGEFPIVADYAQHDAALAAFAMHLRTRLLETSRAAGASGPRRIYLVRKEGVRRDHNQAELLTIAERYGFTPVAPETLSLPDQARLLLDAEYLIGASGAAWAGLLFCGAPIHGISWLPPEFREFCSYATLAGLLGHSLTFIPAIPEKAIRSSDDVYEAGYRVDPAAFETAILRMMNRAAKEQAA